MRLASLEEKVDQLKKKEAKAREGEGEELHDYGSEAAKKEWMKMGKEEKEESHYRRRGRSRSRSSTRSRSRSHHRHHRHEHRHRK